MTASAKCTSELYGCARAPRCPVTRRAKAVLNAQPQSESASFPFYTYQSEADPIGIKPTDCWDASMVRIVIWALDQLRIAIALPLAG